MCVSFGPRFVTIFGLHSFGLFGEQLSRFARLPRFQPLLLVSRQFGYFYLLFVHFVHFGPFLVFFRLFCSFLTIFGHFRGFSWFQSVFDTFGSILDHFLGF